MQNAYKNFHGEQISSEGISGPNANQKVHNHGKAYAEKKG